MATQTILAPAQTDLLAILAAKEAQFAAELDELRGQGYPIVVNARTLLAAELQGKILDLETGLPIEE